MQEKNKEIEELEGVQKELEMSSGSMQQSSGLASRRAKSVPASLLADRSARKEVQWARNFLQVSSVVVRLGCCSPGGLSPDLNLLFST